MAAEWHKKCADCSPQGRTLASSSTGSCPLLVDFARLQTEMVTACRKDFNVCALKPASLFAFTVTMGVFACFANSFDLSGRDSDLELSYRICGDCGGLG